MTYDELIIESTEDGIDVVEKTFKSKALALIKGNKIAIRKDIPTLKEKHCVLAEELGHFHTTVGDITDLKDRRNYKQELTARRWGYNRTIGLLGIIQAYEYGCMSVYEISEFLNVTETYLREALNWYRSKYGVYTQVDNYIIYFEPSLTVGKII